MMFGLPKIDMIANTSEWIMIVANERNLENQTIGEDMCMLASPLKSWHQYYLGKNLASHPKQTLGDIPHDIN